MKNLDDSICGQIEDWLTRDDCYFELAVKKNDPALCKRIETQERKECLAKVKSND